jgi:lysophospholipase L1-like esterase
VEFTPGRLIGKDAYGVQRPALECLTVGPLKTNKLKFSMVLILGIVAVTSVVINGFLFQEMEFYYKEINRLRLDPLESGLLKDAATAPAADKNDRLAIFFGDSRIAKWRPMLDVPGWKIINRGIKGQTTNQLLLRLQKDVLVFSPDAVVLQAGINDLKTMEMFPERKNEIIADCKLNLTIIIKEIAAAHIQTIVLTIFPTGKPGIIRSRFWSRETTAAIDQLNLYLTSLGNDRVHVINTDTVLRRRQYIHPKYQRDMLHLTPKGYARLNDLLRIHLKSALQLPLGAH